MFEGKEKRLDLINELRAGALRLGGEGEAEAKERCRAQGARHFWVLGQHMLQRPPYGHSAWFAVGAAFTRLYDACPRPSFAGSLTSLDRRFVSAARTFLYHLVSARARL